MINKYEINWQIARLRAKKCRHVEGKIATVSRFLGENYDNANLVRVTNWAKMTALGYKSKNQEAVELLNSFVSTLSTDVFSTREYFENDFSAYSTAELRDLLKDLKSRKFNFHYTKLPKDHILFVAELEKYLA